MKIRLRYCLLQVLTLLSFFTKAQQNYIDYVNPFVGTGGHGHTYPGATVPHGMVQLSPDTRLEGWDGCGGYHYSDTFIYGFSHTHLSGTGVSDYGDILFMPMGNTPSPWNKVYGSSFDHAREKASPGFYSVHLKDEDIDVALTATERVGVHHYRFNRAGPQNVLLDLLHRDEVIESSLQVEDSVTVTGMRRSSAWAKNQVVFFAAKFSQPFSRSGIWESDAFSGLDISRTITGKNIKAFFSFDSTKQADIFIQVALSPVSVEGAKRNLDAEALGKTFDQVKTEAEAKWNAELSKIDVKDNDPKKMRIFYTALYHTAIVPNINMDTDGSYRGMDNKIHKAEDFTYYSVFSLWDTYRATHPLYTIIDRKRTLDYIKTFLVHFQQGGRLPVWELASNETDCMIGYHSVPVITDAYVKGITAFDTLLALKAMQKSAEWDHYGLPAYRLKGVINTEDEHESVSKTLEYAYDDYCIAVFAKAMGDTALFNKFITRSQYYRHVLDTKTGFMRPRKNGGWWSPFDPREVNNHYTEANSWQYSFYAPHDVNHHINALGGSAKFEKKLDALFSADSKTTGREQSDITGLIGQYAHGNEPSHHIAYLYNYTGKAHKTQALVHRIMKEMYQDAPDGLIGNEDCGQMSAWYVMSALGFYPVTPGSTKYLIGKPAFPLAEIRLENEKSFIINAPGLSDSNIYIQSSLLSTTKSLRPRNWDAAWIDHEAIAGGGLITFMMGSKPSNCFSKPIIQKINHEAIVQNPIINGGDVSFRNSRKVVISSPQLHTKIYYSVDGSRPTVKSKLYTGPFSINKSLVLMAIAVDAKGRSSFISRAEYYKINHQWSVSYQSPFEKQYDGGGADGLIDGIRGTTNWRMGNWQGYRFSDMDVVIDMKRQNAISNVRIGFLQETGAWIVMPKQVAVEVSTDGVSYSEVYRGSNYLPIEKTEPTLFTVDAGFKKLTARYIRIRAMQYGKLPAWHLGAGGDPHIFIDEVEIK